MSGVGKELAEKLDQKISLISSVADLIPGVIIIHGLPEMNILYMSNLGVSLLGITVEKVKSMSYPEFQERFFNEEDSKDYTPRILGLLQNNSTDELVSYFQQVRTSKDREWDWYMSMTKVFVRDEWNQPVALITIAQKIDPEHYFTSKATRLLEENTFLKNHHAEFDRLTKREKMILKLLATGKSARQIAKELHISPATAETHRKRVREKLAARNSHDLAQYARAFDLI